MNNKDCMFCKIVKGEIPSYKIYEEDYYAFLDISQFTKGHTIVISKKHIKLVWDSKEIGKFFSIVLKIARHFRSIDFKHVDSMIFGRKIPHAHVNLIPHNNESGDCKKKTLENIGSLQTNISRRPAPEKAKKMLKNSGSFEIRNIYSIIYWLKALISWSRRQES